MQFLSFCPRRAAAPVLGGHFVSAFSWSQRDAVAKNMTLEQRIDQLPELPVETFEVLSELGHADNVPIVTIRPEQASHAG